MEFVVIVTFNPSFCCAGLCRIVRHVLLRVEVSLPAVLC